MANNGAAMKVLVALVVSVLVVCSGEELCTSWKKETVRVNVTSEDFPVKLTLLHDFLHIQKGIVPGLRYNGKLTFFEIKILHS